MMTNEVGNTSLNVSLIKDPKLKKKKKEHDEIESMDEI
jgi:hypothetical protein